MPIVERWTGREVKALRQALRMSQYDFATALGVAKRSVINWESKGDHARPRPEMQAALDTKLRQLGKDAAALFECLLRDPDFAPGDHVGRSVTSSAPEKTSSQEADDKIIVSARMKNGRIVLVAVPRRTLLVGAFGAALATRTNPARQKQQPEQTTLVGHIPGDMHPVEGFRRVRAVLVDQDNLVGPAFVLPAVRQQMELIRQARYELEGEDDRALLNIQAEFVEFAGWLCQDLGDFDGARQALSDALEKAHAVDDVELVAYILARKSQLAGDMNDPLAAIDMAKAAKNSAGDRFRLGAASAIYGAYGHALLGEESQCKGAIEAALAGIEQSAQQPPTKWASWLDRAYIQVQNGRCLTQLKEYPAAIAAYQEALDALPPDYRRDRGVYLARQAFAYARAGSINSASSLGRQAAKIAMTTGSLRIVTELGRVDTELDPWARTRAVRDFRGLPA